MPVFTNEELQLYKSSGLPSNAPQKAAPKQAPGGLRGLLTSFLPTIAGGAGAVVGTLAGPAGTIGGGALGAGLGEYLRQKLTGEADDGIDKGNLVQEGAFGALPGIFKGAKALKGARNAQKAVTAASAADKAVDTSRGLKGYLSSAGKADLKLWKKQGLISPDDIKYADDNLGAISGAKATVKAPQTTEAALQARRGIVQKTGEGLTRAGSGLKVGKNVGDIEKLDDLSKVAAKYPGMPKTQLRKISADMGKLDDEVSNILAKNPIKVNGKDVGAKIQAAIDDPNLFTELDLSSADAQRALQNHITKFANSKTALDVNNYVKTLNKTAIRAKDKLTRGVPLTGKENAALAAKSAGDDVLKEFPEVAPLKKQMAQLFEINPQIAIESERGFSVPFMGGTKIKTPYQAVKGVASRAGSVAQGASPVIPGLPQTGSLPGQIVKASISQAKPRVGGMLFGMPYVGSTPAPAADPSLEAPIDGELMDPMMDQPAPEPQSTSPFAPENVEANLARLSEAGASDKDIMQYLGLVETMAKFQPKGPKPPTATQVQQANNANSAMQDIQLIRDTLTNDSSAAFKASIPGGSLARRVTGTADYEAAKKNIGDVLARLRSGAAITNDEYKRYVAMLPQTFDDSSVATRKLDRLEMLLGQFANPVGAGADLAALE